MTLTPNGRLDRLVAAAAIAVAACVLAGLTGGCSAMRTLTTSGRPVMRPSRQPVLSAQVRRALAGRYLAIAIPANHRLEIEVDGFADRQRHGDLAGAVADLRAQAATERQFDGQLARIGFPAAIAAIASALISANQHRIGLAGIEAGSASIISLRSFAAAHRAADAAVEAQVRLIRRALGLPPPSDS